MGITEKSGVFGPGSVSRPLASDARAATLHDLVDANRNIGRTLKGAIDRGGDLRYLASRIDYVANQLLVQAQGQHARWSLVNQAFTQAAAAFDEMRDQVAAARRCQFEYHDRLQKAVRDFDEAKARLPALDEVPVATKDAKHAKEGKALATREPPVVAAVKLHFHLVHQHVDMTATLAKDVGHGLDALDASIHIAAQRCLATKQLLEALDGALSAPPEPAPAPPPAAPTPPPDPVRVRARTVLDQFNDGGFAITGRQEEVAAERAAESGLLAREIADEVPQPDLDDVNLRKPWRQRGDPRGRGGAGLESEVIGGIADVGDAIDEVRTGTNPGPRS